MLYQKIRPTSLDEVVGNSNTVGVLKQQIRLTPDKRFHSILFQGPKGCGKTTLARILSKEYGCTETNTFEINAANLRGIDTVRDVGEKAYLAPLGGKAKVYIFDEAASFTKDAQQALLKITEECPDHCYFFFCTTDPQNLLDTLRNRCLVLDVSVLSNKKILELLNNVCKKENLNISEEVLEFIACNCEGTPRTAIQLLEKVIGIKDVDEAICLVISGTEEQSEILDLCKLLVMSPERRRKDWKKILLTFESIQEQNSERIRYAILGFLRKKILQFKLEEFEYVQDIAELMEIFSASTYYGGRNQLFVLLVRSCFGGKKNEW